ncbi:DUF6288 domain-containing protein [Haloferula chungangensis]|uniref:DUF6288 domain-containing protein n=1 Tax=Haloferula chungangensis TaxID=1048331 RepID=A0ABW2L6K4_9BACT
MTTIPMTLSLSRLLTLIGSLLLNFGPVLLAAGGNSGPAPKVPDLTAGGHCDENHDWTLGPTGARGWIHAGNLDTCDARQILITAVARNSPASEALKVGDVILGVSSKPFDSDARVAFGKAITTAEAGTGDLTLLRWRDGKEESVTIELPVLGSYSATAPYDCPKSKAIFENGCEALAEQMRAKKNRGNPITRSLNAMALLASGDRKYRDLIREEAQWAANYRITELRGFQSWYYGYANLFLAEYVLATGDPSVVPGMKRMSLEIAHGQSKVGTWGHTFARKVDGILMGYGAMNAPALSLTMSLVLAREAGVSDPAIDRAIENSDLLLSFYIGKGAIPYGDHEPWTKTHDDNGKGSAAAVMFDLMGDPHGTAFFSRMATASHNGERDGGHTGNFLNILWALPGVSRLGPHATGAWIEEFGWYFDFARRHDGTFLYQGEPGMNKKNHAYAGWDSTGAYLLSYALPLKSLRLTGKKPSCIPPADQSEAAMVIAAGKDWSQQHGTERYSRYDVESLMAGLSSWSPTLRERCAAELASRQANIVPRLIELLESDDMNSRLGACAGLKRSGQRGAPAAKLLRKMLSEDDMWLRIQAAEALASIGPAGRAAIPDLLRLASRDIADDPRGMTQRYLAFILFQKPMSGRSAGLLSRSLDGVDQKDLKEAVTSILSNQDGRARGAVSSIFDNLSYKEIEPLLPAIYEAVAHQAPSGIMFGDLIRLNGMNYLAKHHIKEGLPLTVALIEPDRWGQGRRFAPCLKALLLYGKEAQSQLPELRRLEELLVERSKGKKPDKNLELLRSTIKQVEAATESPKLQDLPG